ncbi:CRISPR-associated endoribonuclease Cas6 [Thermosulfurimonas sp. F29]|uniref:CRISPR-associated endoribonuclease Cas6 n=1 Tax=Thermosulfurimonas sp. F29 TaxID=2867247 RepID=UPI001C8294B8|nr:CRISPR-associated endoribonuclease Cas6 [Thermosulfurimonas sp. F29]MBX6424178.1 hypothetical protein [Thermosulfurimonas sp. F29]
MMGLEVLTRFQVWFPARLVRRREKGKNVDRHIVQGVVNRNFLPPEVSAFLHSSGNGNGRTYRPLVVSDIRFPREGVGTLVFGLFADAPVQRDIELWLKAREVPYRRFDVSMELLAKRDRFALLSPVLSRTADGRYPHPAREKEAFEEALTVNLRGKLVRYGFVEDAPQDVCVELLKGRIARRDFNGKAYRGFLGFLRIKGACGLAAIAAYALGVGVRNAQGFGMPALPEELRRFLEPLEMARRHISTSFIAL